MMLCVYGSGNSSTFGVLTNKAAAPCLVKKSRTNILNDDVSSIRMALGVDRPPQMLPRGSTDGITRKAFLARAHPTFVFLSGPVKCSDVPALGGGGGLGYRLVVASCQMVVGAIAAVERATSIMPLPLFLKSH